MHFFKKSASSLPRWTHLWSTFMENTANSKLTQGLFERVSMVAPEPTPLDPQPGPNPESLEGKYGLLLTKVRKSFGRRVKAKGSAAWSPAPYRERQAGRDMPAWPTRAVGRFTVHLHSRSLIKIRVLSHPCTRDRDFKTSYLIAWKHPETHLSLSNVSDQCHKTQLPSYQGIRIHRARTTRGCL